MFWRNLNVFLTAFLLTSAFVRPDRAGRFRAGMWLLAAANVGFLVTLTLPVLVAAALGKPEYQLFGFVLLPTMALGFILGPIGLVMVLTSGA